MQATHRFLPRAQKQIRIRMVAVAFRVAVAFHRAFRRDSARGAEYGSALAQAGDTVTAKKLRDLASRDTLSRLANPYANSNVKIIIKVARARARAFPRSISSRGNVLATRSNLRQLDATNHTQITRSSRAVVLRRVNFISAHDIRYRSLKPSESKDDSNRARRSSSTLEFDFIVEFVGRETPVLGRRCSIVRARIETARNLH